MRWGYGRYNMVWCHDFPLRRLAKVLFHFYFLCWVFWRLNGEERAEEPHEGSYCTRSILGIFWRRLNV